MGELRRGFTNIGARSRVRAFPGFPMPAEAVHHRLGPRGCLCLGVHAGDLITLAGGDGNVAIAAFDARGGSCLAALGLVPASDISDLQLDLDALNGWAAARGLEPADFAMAVMPVGERVVFKAETPCTLWIMVPADALQLVLGGALSTLEVSLSRAGPAPILPEPLGPVEDEFTVDRGTGRAYRLAKGAFVQIIDVHGQQCSDFMAFRASALDAGEEVMIDATATRSMVRRSYPRPGVLDSFFDHKAAPLLQVVQDTCGRHDTFGLACTARGYEDRGFPGHLNCSDNMSNALSPYGVASRAAWPAVNFFWNTWIDPHTHDILTEESHSRPGDYVLMRALTDLICVSTACPDDIDPINGWNPTDIHVRIYRAETPFRRAVAYRVKEDAPMTISRESAFHPRTAALTQDMAPSRDLWMPNSYPANGTLGEYWACRETVALQDMSSLRKYDIVGPDAESVLQRLVTRDLSRLALWRGTYALMCDETGAVVDDGTLFRLGPELFRWCCGAEESGRRIEAFAEQEGLQVRVMDMSDALANVALQGPKSRDLLRALVCTRPTVPSLDQLKWFGVTIARLNDRDGTPFMLSRTGYTGELGYELFCAKADALSVWDALMENGAAHGIKPMGAAALNTIRIEAGFAAAGAEFGPGHDAWEAGLGFAIDLRKADFCGKAALERNAQAPRRVLRGLLLQGNDVPRDGAPVYLGEREVGRVTSATRSPMLGHGIAMARLAVEFADKGTALQVGMMDGRMKTLPACVGDVPFVDPRRERARV